eukprot:1341244-Prymnesium_polylepis.1
MSYAVRVRGSRHGVACRFFLSGLVLCRAIRASAGVHYGVQVDSVLAAARILSPTRPREAAKHTGSP